MFFRVKHCSLWYVIPAVGGEGQPDDLEKFCRPRAVNFFLGPPWRTLKENVSIIDSEHDILTLMK